MSKAPEPIMVACEGSGCPTHYGWMCAMCGEPVTVDARDYARPHYRKDILAMLDRGDFG